MKTKLKEAAKKASTYAHSPYSNALVGSAILTESGQIYSGCNVENASYGGTVCAERVAIFKAVSEGHKKITKVYVYTKEGWPPCGMCRQVIAEFGGPDTEIIIGNEKGEEKSYKFGDIFPLSFTPDKLGK